MKWRKWSDDDNTIRNADGSLADEQIELYENLDESNKIWMISFHEYTKDDVTYLQVNIDFNKEAKSDFEGFNTEKFPGIIRKEGQIIFRCKASEKEKMAEFLYALDSIESLEEIYEDMLLCLKLPNIKEMNKLKETNEKKQFVAQKAAGGLFMAHPTHPLPREVGEEIGKYLPEDVHALLLTTKGAADAGKEGKEETEEKQKLRKAK